MCVYGLNVDEFTFVLLEMIAGMIEWTLNSLVPLPELNFTPNFITFTFFFPISNLSKTSVQLFLLVDLFLCLESQTVLVFSYFACLL